MSKNSPAIHLSPSDVVSEVEETDSLLICTVHPPYHMAIDSTANSVVSVHARNMVFENRKLNVRRQTPWSSQRLFVRAVS